MVGYWGSGAIDLINVVAAYAIASVEGIEINHSDNILVVHTEEARLPSDIIKERFEGCKQILVLRKGVLRGKS